MNIWNSLAKSTQEMLKSWAKVFLAAVATLIASGEKELTSLFLAGFASLIPLLITWLDPSDLRFGKLKEVPKPVKKTTKKK
jgi:hypothetical protein